MRRQQPHRYVVKQFEHSVKVEEDGKAVVYSPLRQWSKASRKGRLEATQSTPFQVTTLTTTLATTTLATTTLATTTLATTHNRPLSRH